ncbi:MAG: glucosyltransferase domain-containing protein [Parasporobacterium sp.]|nr:glucosyltransferase domain-containing protein [Parasporobacterium sp.]
MIENKLKSFFLDKRNLYVLCSILIFSVLAHIYRWTNTIFTHDSLQVYQNDFHWQISLGRYLQHVYLKIRGPITAPFLVSVIAVFFLILSAILIVKILDMKSPLLIVMLCGALATYSALTALHALFLPWLDVFMLGLLFSVFAVYTWAKWKYGWIISAFSLTVAMALYPVFAESAITLCVLYLIKKSLRGTNVRDILKKILFALIFMIVSGLLYYGGWQIAMAITSVQPDTTSHSITALNTLTLANIPALFWNTYKSFFLNILRPDTFHSALIGICKSILLVLSFGPLIYYIKKSKLRVFLIIGVILLPFCMNFVYLLSGGNLYSYMTYPYVFFYVYVIMMFDSFLEGSSERVTATSKKAVKAVLAVLFFVILFNNTIYSNQVYLQKNLKEQATLSVMTRVIDRIETTEGYVPGQTEVVLVGDLNQAQINVKRPGYDFPPLIELHPYGTTYYGTYLGYFRNILGYSINLGPQSLSEEYANNPEVKAMPAFPNNGSCRIIDGRMIIKLSDDMYLQQNEDPFTD